jgi:hypothetical protein
VALLAVSLSGCADEPPPSEGPALQFELPQIASFADPTWSPRASDDDPVAAKVGEATIRLSELQAQVDAKGPGADPRAILERMIEMELLAQEAWRRGMVADDALLAEVKRATVHAMLRDTFIENHGHDDIRKEDFELAFSHPKVRIKFDHFDGYFVSDAQITCCSGDYLLCAEDPPTLKCLDEATPVIMGAYEALKSRGPFKSRPEFEAAVSEVAALFPGLASHEMSFWYEQGVPYEQQKKFDKMHPAFVEAATTTPIFQMAEPVRSYHGWHIVFPYKHIPAEHKTIDDPEVRAAIAENIYPKIVERDFLEFVIKTERAAKIERFPDALAVLQGGAQGEPEATE